MVHHIRVSLWCNYCRLSTAQGITHLCRLNTQHNNVYIKGRCLVIASAFLHLHIHSQLQPLPLSKTCLTLCLMHHQGSRSWSCEPEHVNWRWFVSLFIQTSFGYPSEPKSTSHQNENLYINTHPPFTPVLERVQTAVIVYHSTGYRWPVPWWQFEKAALVLFEVRRWKRAWQSLFMCVL